MAITAGKALLALADGLISGGKIAPDELKVCESAELSTLTGFRTGGKAAAVWPRTEGALLEVLASLRRQNIPFYILGNGSNVLAKDEGYPGVVVCLTELKEMRVAGEKLYAACGAGLTRAAGLAEQHALTGLEVCYGIPGTVGGGVFMNAGAYDGECRDVVTSVRALMPDHTLRVFSPEEMGFGYRTSIFQENGAVILSAEFSLKKGEKSAIRAKMDDLMARRRAKQPLEYPSCGSTFKRYPGRYTAQMIDQAGLKGARIGGAMVSEKHAGFLINYDHASSADILALIRLVQDVILEKEGVRIQCEIRVLE